MLLLDMSNKVFKRTVLAVIIFCSLSFSYAKENSTNDLSFGTFALIQSRKSGGGINFSFPIYSSQTGFFIRDEISASLYLANDFGTDGMLISFGDKLHFGKIIKINDFSFRTYGYMKSEIGTSKDCNYQFFSAPLILELGGAGGFEFLFLQNKGFFVEFGGGAAIASFSVKSNIDKSQIANGNFCGGYVCITTGMKYYF
ncbi:MAG: hypothetical protein J6J00_10545 [Treponema sp.]|nr:hypothetical protein [Treponema sp.]